MIDMLSGIPSPYSNNSKDVSDEDRNNLGLATNVKEISESQAAGSAIFQKFDVFTNKTPSGDATFEDAPALDLNIESKRHSWREVPITW